MISTRQPLGKVMIFTLAMAFAGSAFAGEARWQCSDGIDNDGDGYADAQDTDCGGAGGGSSPNNLMAFLTDLKNRVDSLEAENAALTSQISDLNSQVEQLQAGGGGGGSTNEALNYMSVVDGQLRISDIDLRVVNGNMLIGEGGSGTGMHNLVIGSANDWDGNYNLVIGTNNVAYSERSFIHGAYNYAVGVSNAALLGGEANMVDTDNGTIAGGQDNYVTNAPFATITGGQKRQTSTNSEIIADG